jgi:hypothetical protein
MAHHGSITGSGADDKRSQLHAIVTLARRVHLLSLVLATALAACVVPPPLASDNPDASVNHPPVFRTVRNGAGEELVRPGPLSFVVGQDDLRVTVADSDLSDTLYLRMYISYGVPVATAPRAECRVQPSATPTEERTITCPLLGVCTDDIADGAVRVFEIDVLDREPITSDVRLYRDVTPPGEIATYWWNLMCVSAAS